MCGGNCLRIFFRLTHCKVKLAVSRGDAEAYFVTTTSEDAAEKQANRASQKRSDSSTANHAAKIANGLFRLLLNLSALQVDLGAAEQARADRYELIVGYYCPELPVVFTGYELNCSHLFYPCTFYCDQVYFLRAFNYARERSAHQNRRVAR